MIRLYIENNEIELDKSVTFAITKQFEDLSNPTTIINDWSKTVSIPFTQRNNNIFGHIYNPNKSIVDGGSVGVYFNPLKKLDFRLTWNDTILMMGYAKMNEVKQINGKGTYEITLFGQLGRVFQEMQKITFDTSTDDTNYLIDGSQYVDEYINKDLVYQSWTSSGQTHDQLYPRKLTIQGGIVINHPAYSLTDIIGFAPNNAFGDEFKYDVYQPSSDFTKKFSDTLGTGFTEATGVEPDTAIGNGLFPREIGEYRSYYQLPFIYWNKLFQIFQTKAESITGYNFDLDSTWFNTGNTNWYNLVYMLKPFDVKNGTEKDDVNTYTVFPYSSMGWEAEHGSYTSTLQTHRTRNLCATITYTEQIPLIDSGITGTDGKWYTLSGDGVSTTFKIHSLWGLYDSNGSSSTSTLNNNNALIVCINAVGENGYTKTIKYLIKHSDCSLSESGANVINYDGSTKASSEDRITIDTQFIVTKAEYGNSIRFRFEAYWKNDNWPLTSNGYIVTFYPDEYNNPNRLYISVMNNIRRSFSHFTLNDLWNNDYNLFDEVIKYCKMYRISISVDEIGKKVIFKPYSKYFSGYTVVDWTDMVDKSRDFNIVPITFENKYVLFNYKESSTKSGKEYNEKYGVNYGEYRLTTEYNFNGDTTKLFDNITPSITNTDNVLSWNNLNTYKKIIYSFPAEIFVYNKNKDKKQVDLFGAYYFHCGLSNFSTEAALHLRSVWLTDDTAFQQANNTYCYNQTQDGAINVLTYPHLDIVKGNNLCIFNIPQENYTYLNNYSGKTSIYTSIWENYINERYNVQNKKITCYIKISPLDFTNFDWNKFVRIGNQLCIVNKIYDYDIATNEPTKVDLITIQNVSGYIN